MTDMAVWSLHFAHRAAMDKNWDEAARYLRTAFNHYLRRNEPENMRRVAKSLYEAERRAGLRQTR